jgi:hypothetical protein
VTIVSSSQPITGQAPHQLTVVRRDGSSAAFDPTKISVALSKAFLAVEGSEAGASHRVRDLIADLPEDDPVRRYGEEKLVELDHLGHGTTKGDETGHH